MEPHHNPQEKNEKQNEANDSASAAFDALEFSKRNQVLAQTRSLLAGETADLKAQIDNLDRSSEELVNGLVSHLASFIKDSPSSPLIPRAITAALLISRGPLDLLVREELQEALSETLATLPSSGGNRQLILRALSELSEDGHFPPAAAGNLISFCRKNENITAAELRIVTNILYADSETLRIVLPELWAACSSKELPYPVFKKLFLSVDLTESSSDGVTGAVTTAAEILKRRFKGPREEISSFKKHALKLLESANGKALPALGKLMEGVEAGAIGLQVIPYILDFVTASPATIRRQDLSAAAPYIKKLLELPGADGIEGDAIQKACILASFSAAYDEEMVEAVFEAALSGKVEAYAFQHFIKAAGGSFDERLVSALMEIPFDDHGCKAEKTLIAGCTHMGPIGIQLLAEEIDKDAPVFKLLKVLPAFSQISSDHDEIALAQAKAATDKIAAVISSRYLEVRLLGIKALGNLSSDYNDVVAINRARMIKLPEEPTERMTKMLWKVRAAADEACIAIRGRTGPYEKED